MGKQEKNKEMKYRKENSGQTDSGESLGVKSSNISLEIRDTEVGASVSQ